MPEDEKSPTPAIGEERYDLERAQKEAKEIGDLVGPKGQREDYELANEIVDEERRRKEEEEKDKRRREAIEVFLEKLSVPKGLFRPRIDYIADLDVDEEDIIFKGNVKKTSNGNETVFIEILGINDEGKLSSLKSYPEGSVNITGRDIAEYYRQGYSEVCVLRGLSDWDSGIEAQCDIIKIKQGDNKE